MVTSGRSMMATFGAVLFATGLAAGSPCAAADPALDELRDFSARFEGRKTFGPFTAKAGSIIRLQRLGRHFVYTMHTTVKLAIVERSFVDCAVIRLADDRLLPQEYVHLDSADSTKNVHTRFDWSRKEARTTLGIGPEASILPIEWPTWDPMSYLLALMATAPDRPAGTTESHKVIERGTLKVHSASYSGPLAAAEGSSKAPSFQVISRKNGGNRGQIDLVLTTQPIRRPARVSIEDVAMTYVGDAPAGAAQVTVNSQAPSCPAALPNGPG